MSLNFRLSDYPHMNCGESILFIGLFPSQSEVFLCFFYFFVFYFYLFLFTFYIKGTIIH